MLWGPEEHYARWEQNSSTSHKMVVVESYLYRDLRETPVRIVRTKAAVSSAEDVGKSLVCKRAWGYRRTSVDAAIGYLLV